jgi:hypothetical protein
MIESELLKELQKLEELHKTKTPCEKAYKVHYGSYPITDNTSNEYDELAWNAFRKGYDAGRFSDEP